MTIKRFSIWLFVVVTFMLMVVVALVMGLVVVHGKLVQFEGRRLEAFKLIDQLRQTEDDQTRFARAYVVTGDRKYLEFHGDIVAIRNGLKPRPKQYFRIYWDFAAAGGVYTPNGDVSRAEAIFELLRKADLTPEEQVKLDVAQREAEALLKLETRAFEAMGVGSDAEGGGAPDQALAIRLLNSPDYYIQKAKAMRPIDDFIGLLEARTGPGLVAGIRRVMLLQAGILGVVAALFVVVLFAGRKIMTRVFVPIKGFQERSRMVGLDLKELSRVATRIAKGDFSTAYATQSQTSGIATKDEIGDLSRVQDGMIEHLRVAAIAITRIVGDLGRRAEELRKANAELLANRQKLEVILNSVDDGIQGLDEQGYITFENQAASRMLGADPQDLLGKFAHSTIHHSHADGAPYLVEECPTHATLRDGVVRRIEGEVYWRGDGGHFPVEYVASPIRGDEGGILGAVVVFRDLTERNRQEAKLRESEARLNLALASSGVGTWSWNVGKNDLVWDDYIHPLFGLQPGTFPGRHENFLARVHPEDREQVESAFSDSLERDLPFSSEYRVVLPDGGLRHLASRGMVYRDASGRAARMSGVCWDISDLKAGEERLRRLAEELQRSNKELEHFAYVASHDLQEPLRTVGSFSQLIERRYKGRLDQEADEFIGFIVDGANRMQRLINDLLTYSRVGTRGRTFEPVDLEAVLLTVMRDMEAVIQDSGAHITHDPLPMVAGDEVQLRQLIQNLLGNAIKFRKPGETPEIHLSATRSKRWWEIHVRDNGIGIDSQYFQRVFVIFQRLHARNAYEGTGIGLAVCKKIVERHGGGIWVVSEPGSGATFCFTLPDSKTKHEPS